MAPLPGPDAGRLTSGSAGEAEPLRPGIPSRREPPPPPFTPHRLLPAAKRAAYGGSRRTDLGSGGLRACVRLRGALEAARRPEAICAAAPLRTQRRVNGSLPRSEGERCSGLPRDDDSVFCR